LQCLQRHITDLSSEPPLITAAFHCWFEVSEYSVFSAAAAHR